MLVIDKHQDQTGLYSFFHWNS